MVEVAHTIVRLTELARQLPGVQLNVGRVSGGGPANVVPERAEALLDLRASTVAAMADAVARMTALEPHDGRVRLTVELGVDRPPMERTATVEPLLALARTVAAGVGLELHEAATGGCSEGNLTAGVGTPTLDGLGLPGAGPHALDERIELAALVPRTALLAGLVAALAGSRA